MSITLCRANMQLLGLAFVAGDTGITVNSVALKWRDLGNSAYKDVREISSDVARRLNHLCHTMQMLDRGEMDGKYRRYKLNGYGLSVLTKECERLDREFSGHNQRILKFE